MDHQFLHSISALSTSSINRTTCSHISQIAEDRLENVSDYLSEGQDIEVVVLDVDQRGRIKLSIQELENYRDQNEAC